jgi:pullulanase-type alpha-1,6-glucosidase
VPEDERGTFKAFTETNSNGMKHLIALAQAGLTHIHLLPAFDIATINEDKSQLTEPDAAQLATFPADSDQQQALIQPIRDQDGYNWGYDPFHYTVPEGTYSTNPDGTTRILEFREMVQALNQNGLRVVMDVVYNHTNASGESANSVLDQVVPGYYHRLNASGKVETSTCCQNTATEHYMMEKLMIDSVLTWATAYKVDGFRFDLMGHHLRSNMEDLRAALDVLTPDNGGVDGSKVYVYGEGWDFGEVKDNAIGVNATQLNMGGTGIGTFNDRLRDAVRGGSPFGGYQDQGFAEGLFVDPSGITAGTPDEQKARLLLFSDQIRIGLAGNLRDYAFIGADGNTTTGKDVSYNGSPTGYTLDPQEDIVYVSAHDNETLFDTIQMKAPPTATIADRVRMQNLANSVVMFSQGVAFFHAGDDILRSKSGDKNSYNSGDWFNRLDFTYQTNNWGVGLPPVGDNKDNWSILQPLLANPDLKPTQANIEDALANFEELLEIRKSSPLFHLPTAQDITDRLTFQNVGPDQIPGLIVMTLADGGSLADLDPNYDKIVVLFNSSSQTVTFTDDSLKGVNLELHPVYADSHDPVVKTSTFDSAAGTFSIPGRTTAVFVLKQGG